MVARGVVTALLACSLIFGTGENYNMAQAQPNSKAERSSQRASPQVEKYLLTGKLADGEKALKAQLSSHPRDDQARFGLGMLQFLQAIESASQQINHYGIRSWQARLPAQLSMFKTPVNQQPQQISYENFRQIISNFHDKIEEADSTLCGITSGDVSLPIHFGLIELDFTGRGETERDLAKRRLWQLYSEISNNTRINLSEAESFFIKFDRGDVHWLRGYCHVFMALTNIVLAHDFQKSFESSAHLIFARVKSPYEFLAQRRLNGMESRQRGTINDILDAIGGLHHLQCDVVEPERMKHALNDLEEIVAQSRESWRWIMAETDDDHEWLPNPRQSGVIPNVRVTEEMVRSWMEIMDENEKITQGKLLIPFWRGSDTEIGINLRQVFLEPRRFDLIDWVQGVAAEPYLQKGELSRGDNWNRMQGPFQSNFPGFVFYFN